MEKAKVYFSSRVCNKKQNLLSKLTQLYDISGYSKYLNKGELIAIKTHFGESGNTTFLRPQYLQPIIEKLKSSGTNPFVTDTNTLYHGNRGNAVSHLLLANKHGFNISTLGVPVIIADGLNGKDFVVVPIKGKRLKEVKIGSAIYYAEGLVVMTHFKGHLLHGFGGSIKNLGMGSGSRGGKQIMHSDIKPKVNKKKCKSCGKCIKYCPQKAIEFQEDKKAYISEDLCYGCGECVVSCKHEAIAINWIDSNEAVMEKTVEYALGAIQNKNHPPLYFNFLMDITPDCDCWTISELPIVPDIGILASFDPVAIDKASLDLVNEQAGIKGSFLKNPDSHDKFRDLYEKADYKYLFNHAQTLGLGTTDYELITV